MNRRRFIAGLATGCAILGFDPLARRWITRADGAENPADPLPPLDGEIITDPASLGARSADEGNIVHHRPWAILLPGSANDIAAMIQYCRVHAIHVAARGQGHTVFGQSQVEAGLMVETRTLAAIHGIGPDEVDVEAGILWSQLFEQTLAQGLTPPVFTGFLELSVGGTLSVGGVSANNHGGLQIDHVRELEVVTGAGQIVTCSPTSNADLFESVLGGLGQFGWR